MRSSQLSERPGSLANRAAGQAEPANDFSENNPWREAAVVLGSKVRRHFGALLLVALVGAALGGAAKTVLLTNYKATAEILIDPHRGAALGDDASASNLDANGAIDFVESQMDVMRSDRVLVRVLREQGLAGETTKESPQSTRAADLAENNALVALKKAVTITRAERSLLVSVSVAGETPEEAARLANAVVKAYGDVNLVDRAAEAGKLSTEFDKQIADLRQDLDAGESSLQAFARSHDLVGLNDKAIVERMTTDATDALSSAENRESQAKARLKQLDAPLDQLASVSTLGADPESRELQVLIDGRVPAIAQLEQLAGTLGERHPAVVAARSQVRSFDQRIAQNLQGLRQAARAQLAEAQAQVAALKQKVAKLATELSKKREYDGPLREMQDALTAKRNALTELERRRREANNSRQVQEIDFRIVSPARAPSMRSPAVTLAPWVLGGALAGLALALAALALTALFEDAEPAKDRAKLVPKGGAVERIPPPMITPASAQAPLPAPPFTPPPTPRVAPQHVAPPAAPAPSAANRTERLGALRRRRRAEKPERFVVGEVALPPARMRRMTLDRLDLTALGFLTLSRKSVAREYEAILRSLPQPLKPPNIVVVTGSNDGDARTSLSINLALCATREGARVALVEGAGRNARITRAVRHATLSPILTGGPVYETENDVTLVLPKAGEEGRGGLHPLRALAELAASRGREFDLIICDGPDTNELDAAEFFKSAVAIVALDDAETLARLDARGCAPSAVAHVAAAAGQRRRA